MMAGRQVSEGSSADGILAVHISNRYLDLEPVILEAANAHGKVTRYVSTDSDGDRYTVKLTGAGEAQVAQLLTAPGQGPIDTIMFTGTDAKSALSITVKKVGAGGGIDGEDIVTHLIARDAIAEFVAAKRAEGVGIDVKLLLLLGAAIGR